MHLLDSFTDGGYEFNHSQQEQCIGKTCLLHCFTGVLLNLFYLILLCGTETQQCSMATMIGHKPIEKGIPLLLGCW